MKATKRGSTTVETSKAFGVTKETLSRWVKLGLPVRREKGRHYFNHDEVRAWMAANAKTGEPGRPAEANGLSAFGVPSFAEGDGGSSLKAKLGRAELARRLAMARLWNHRFEVERGKFISVEEIERGWVRRVFAVKAGLLSLPGRLSEQLAYQGDPREVDRILTDAIHHLLADFSNNYAPFDVVRPEVVARVLGVPVEDLLAPVDRA